MRIVTFASGSTGNCSLITDGKANILIDAGISMRRTVAALGELGLTPQDLCGVLITHEHSDHISGLSMLVKHHNLKIFAPEDLSWTLCRINPQLKENINYIPVSEPCDLSGINVTAFPTPHDAAYSYGYRFEGSSVIAFATDTGCVTDDMLAGLTGADIALIEANHDTDMLKYGPYPYHLKRRISSPCGHLSNYDCGKLALHLAKYGTKHIILGHLSRENNTPEIALKAVKSALEGQNVDISVAPMNNMLAVSVGERVQC